MFGLSLRMCSELAVSEINAVGGLLGLPVVLHHVDGGAPPDDVEAEIARLVREGRVDAVVGWQLPAPGTGAPADTVARIATAPDDLGRPAPGVLHAGETPAAQLAPALAWMAARQDVRRWAVIGTDAPWARACAAAAGREAAAQHGAVVDTRFVAPGTHDFADVVDRLAECGAAGTGGVEGVLMLLVGEDAVHFNRAFAAAGLDARLPRLSTLMDENVLLASGPRATHALFAAAGWFEDLATAESLDFTARYARRFGIHAPLPSSVGESCYEALLLFAELVRRARSLHRDVLLAAGEDLHYGGPRGEVVVHDRHTVHHVYLARARDLSFEVVARLADGVTAP